MMEAFAGELGKGPGWPAASPDCSHENVGTQHSQCIRCPLPGSTWGTSALLFLNTYERQPKKLYCLQTMITSSEAKTTSVQASLMSFPVMKL